MNTKHMGDIAEQAAVLAALRRGWGVLRPLGDNLPYGISARTRSPRSGKGQTMPALELFGPRRVPDGEATVCLAALPPAMANGLDAKRHMARADSNPNPRRSDKIPA